MKIGIIAEFNPLHNGHLYLINKIKEKYEDASIILVLSGNYTQRGIPSIIDKWKKTELSLKLGIDLVVELPFPFSTQSADYFAYGATTILNYLKVDKLVFGSESNDIDNLIELANIQINNKEYEDKVKEYMDLGNNYPTSLSKALTDITNKTINLPNDLLGLSYVKEIIKKKSNIKPITILRTNDYHDKEINNSITSATSIREAIKNNLDIKNNVPKETLDCIIKNDILNNYFKLLKYKILSDISNLNSYLDVSEGLDNLIRKNIVKVNSYTELIESIKTKRYTYNRLNRMFIHILLNIKKEDVNKLKEINYIRILGFTSIGKKYIKDLRKELNIPIITNYSDINDNNLEFELYVTSIYNEIIERNDLNLIELKSIPKE